MSKTDQAQEQDIENTGHDPETRRIRGHGALHRAPGHRPAHLHPHQARHPAALASNRRRRLRRLHRWTGATFGVFLVLLAISGILINHAHELGLDQRTIGSGWLLEWYGVPTSSSPPAVRIDENWLTWTAGSIAYVDGSHHLDALIGAVATGNLVVVAGPTSLLVLLREGGDLVERLPGPGPVIDAIGLTDDDRFVLLSGNQHFVADDELLEFVPVSDELAVNWNHPETLAGDNRDPIAGVAPELTWERLLLDLHGGRLFGISGRVLADLAALAILYLFVSGLMTWRRNGSGKRKD